MDFCFKFSLILIGIAASTAAAVPNYRVDSSDFDFGMVPPNATVTHRVWVHAGESDTLNLVDIKTGCGCLTAPWTETQVLPGDSLGILFYWQTRGSLGSKTVSAYLYVEPDPFPREIRLKGNVVTLTQAEASLTWTPSVLVFKDIRDRNLKQTFQMTNKIDMAQTIRLIETGPAVVVEIPESLDPGRPARGQVGLIVTDTLPAFESSFTIELAGNQKPVFRVTIPVVCGDFSFRPVFTTTENNWQ